MSAFNETTPQINQPFPKVPDNHATLEARRQQAETLESQLKGLSKVIESLVKQRKDLGQAMLELGDSLVGLSGVEQDPKLSNKLLVLGNIHKKVKDVQEKQVNHCICVIDV